jgi:hypothetical protein
MTQLEKLGILGVERRSRAYQCSDVGALHLARERIERLRLLLVCSCKLARVLVDRGERHDVGSR